jgi:hypothetical protein
MVHNLGSIQEQISVGVEGTLLLFTGTEERRVNAVQGQLKNVFQLPNVVK